MFSKTLFFLCLVGLLTPLLAYPLPVADGKITRGFIHLMLPLLHFQLCDNRGTVRSLTYEKWLRNASSGRKTLASAK